jgi:hypothetical protein
LEKVEFKKRRSCEERRFFMGTSFGARGIKTAVGTRRPFLLLYLLLGAVKMKACERERS